MNADHWPALVAIILALGVVAGIVLLAVSELDHGTAGHISAEEATLLSTVLGASVGAVAAYLGAYGATRNGRAPEETPGRNASEHAPSEGGADSTAP